MKTETGRRVVDAIEVLPLCLDTPFRMSPAAVACPAGVTEPEKPWCTCTPPVRAARQEVAS
jgi:hypothetical protein